MDAELVTNNKNTSFENDYLKLWYRQPASRWQEAMPLGNGRMGAMITGDPVKEIIDLTEITCFSGEIHNNDTYKESHYYFYKAREALINKDYPLSQKYLQQYIGERQNYGTHLPLGHLVITTEHKDMNVSNYIRSLNLNTAVSEVSYNINSHSFYSRTAFISNPQQIMIIKFEAEDGCLNLALSLDGGNNPYQVCVDETGYFLTGNAFESKHSDGKTGVSFAAELHVESTGGSVYTENKQIYIADAKSAIVYIAIETDFKGLKPIKLCRQRIQKALSYSFDELLQNHINDYQELFNRVNFYLGESEGLPTDVLVKQVQEGSVSPYLTSLMFQYGRYLLISSSRHNSPLPTQLQGVWNDSVACNIGWTCDMHLDINTQMNYWPVETTNLSECHVPLFQWIENSLVPSGRKTARLFYNLNGWVAELVSNAWGYTNPYWHINLSPCPTGGAWIATHLWEHYLFTQDKDFLQEHVLPVIEEAAIFFMGYLFEDPETGHLTSGPSISPENHFLVDGKPYSASIGPVYEIVVIREIFDIYLKSCEILGISGDFFENVKDAKNALPPFKISENGELKEWSHNYKASDPQHRHTSHLLALFPFSQITPEHTPDLARAARVTIEKRMTPEEIWEDTGWARSMLMLYSARLKDGRAAFDHILNMQQKLTNPNLMVKHPPTRGAPSFADVYELDGNTGLTACIAELLLQSHNDEIELLPALPDSWETGSISGLCARGGFVINMEWKDLSLIKVQVYSLSDNICKIRYGDRAIKLVTETKHTYCYDGNLEPW